MRHPFELQVQPGPPAPRSLVQPALRFGLGTSKRRGWLEGEVCMYRLASRYATAVDSNGRA
jgi:hypothetical protein